MEGTQERLEGIEVTATDDDGAIEVVANGKKEIVSIKMDENLVKDGGAEVLQDMVVAAVSGATRKALDMSESELGEITGGINIPGF